MKRKAVSLFLVALILLFAGCSAEKAEQSDAESTSAAKITVTLKCECITALNAGIRSRSGFDKLIPSTGVLFSGDLVVDEGTTALEALGQAAKINSVNISVKSGYVYAVNGLKEGDCGGTSGWLYAVNGKGPGVSSDKYVLQDGDSVVLFYTVVSDDITGVAWE